MYGASAISDYGDGFPVEVVVVIPAGGVDGFSFEGVAAFDFGIAGAVELSDARDEKLGGEGVSVGGCDAPGGGIFVEGGFFEFFVESYVPVEIVFVCAGVDVFEDFGLFGEFSCPVGFGFEREGVEHGGHVAA